MAVNRFDRPIDSQFINTYVPIPFEQMMQAGAMKQQRYDQSAAAMDQSIARAENINAIPNSRDALERDAALEKIYGIRDKYAGKDLSDSMVIRQLNNEIRSAVRPEDIKKWETTYAGWENYQKNKASMISKGQQVYGDVDFTGYDSSVDGVFSGLPTMDLGRQVNPTIDQFMAQVQADYREETQPSGRIAMIQYRDINKLNDLIDNGSADLFNNPVIQQFMDKEGLNESSFKELLKAKAPSYIKATPTSTYAPAETESGGGLSPYGFSMRLKGEGKIENISAKQLGRDIDESQAKVTASTELLENMELEGSTYTDEEVERQRSINEADKNIHNAMVSKRDATLDQVDNEFAEPKAIVYDEYFALLTTDGGLSDSEAKKVLEAAAQPEEETVYLTEEDAGTAERITKNVGKSLGGSFKNIGDIFASMGKKMTDGAVGITENYKDELEAIGVAQKKREKEALQQAFSQTETVDEIGFGQRKNVNGFIQIEGYDGKMHASPIQPVTDYLLSHPEKFMVNSTNPAINKNPHEYIRAANRSEESNLKLRSVSGAPDVNGNVVLFYDLTGPKEKKEGTIAVTLEDATQIRQVMKELVVQGDPIGAAQLSYGYFYPEAKQNEGAANASYTLYKQNLDPNTASSEPILEDAANVTFDSNTGLYTISLGNTPVATARSTQELGSLLTQLQMIALGQDVQ